MPVQIARTILLDHKIFYIALSRVFGLGHARSLALAESVGISKDMKVADVKAQQVQEINQLIQDNYVVGDQLKRKVRDDIIKKINMNSRAGWLHARNLPVHGQISGKKTAKKMNWLERLDPSK